MPESCGPKRAFRVTVPQWRFGWLTWKRTLLLLVVLASGAACAALLVVSGKMILAVFLGVVLAVAIRPAMEQVARSGLSRGTATGLVFLILAAGLGVATALAIPLIEEQAISFWSSIPRICQRASNWMPRALLGEDRVGEVHLACANMVTRKDTASAILAPYLTEIPKAAWTLTIILGVAFIWTRDRETLLRSASMFASEVRREKFRTFFESVEARLGAFLRAQLALSALVAFITGIFCWAVGIPNVLLIVTFAAVGETLPLVGPVLVGFFMLASVLGPRPELVPVIIIFAVVLRGFVDYLLMPYLVGKTADVNPLLLLLCVLGLGTVAGLLGITAAAPVAAVIQLVLSLSLGIQWQAGPNPDRGKWAMLAYQAHAAAISARRLGKDRVSRGEDATMEDSTETLALDLRRYVGLRAEEEHSS